ncbi:MAG TPA: tripartite tricarboxylate transporter TctB family protein [Caldimonas sp.]|nr:tripartite tricarboxylate transporter TctB family protein [Caldimonas sp.]HEX2540558.1 tripartite tricarboxylate transporter TctB family protein [Caldimonas sp.]
MRSADRIAGAALLALGVAFSAGALTHYAYWGENGPGPAFLPFWLGLSMAVLAATLLIGAMRSGDPGEAWLPRGEGLRRLVLVFGLSVAFVALLKVVGMALGTVLFLIALLRGLDRQPWHVTVAVALAVAAANYLIFIHWLKVPMPVGVLGF